MVRCEACGEEFRTLDAQMEHGGAFTCCQRKLEELRAQFEALKEASLDRHGNFVFCARCAGLLDYSGEAKRLLRLGHVGRCPVEYALTAFSSSDC